MSVSSFPSSASFCIGDQPAASDSGSSGPPARRAALPAPPLQGHTNPSMSEKIRYTGERLGDLGVVPDFLPRPEDLVFRDEGVKVTISLSKRTVEFFKSEARKHKHAIPAHDPAAAGRICAASREANGTPHTKPIEGKPMRTGLFLLSGFFFVAGSLIIAKLFAAHLPGATTIATVLFIVLWLAMTG